MQTTIYEHVFPLLKTCDFSPLEHQASGVLDDYSFFPWVFSPPIDMIKLWCDLSLPLWHQFPRRVLLDFLVVMGLILESQNKAAIWVGCWSRTRFIEWSWIKKNAESSGKPYFLEWNQWHRVLCFGCTKMVRLDRKQQTGVTEVIIEKTLVTSAH